MKSEGHTSHQTRWWSLDTKCLPCDACAACQFNVGLRDDKRPQKKNSSHNEYKWQQVCLLCSGCILWEQSSLEPIRRDKKKNQRRERQRKGERGRMCESVYEAVIIFPVHQMVFLVSPFRSSSSAATVHHENLRIEWVRMEERKRRSTRERWRRRRSGDTVNLAASVNSDVDTRK